MKSVRLMTLLLVAPIAAQAQNPPPPIIDMHLHAITADANGPPPLAMCRSGAPFPPLDPARPWPQVFIEHAKKPTCPDVMWSPVTDEELMTRSLEVLERRNIYAVTSGKLLDRWREPGGGRIIPALGLHARPDAPKPEQVRELFANGTYRVFGEIGVQYEGMAPDDPWLEPYFAVAEQLDVPVGIHIGTGPPGAPYLPGMNRYRAKLHSALLLEEVLIRHPKLRIYIMHAGWPMIDDLLALMWAHPQVHVDVGVISFAIPRKEFHAYLQRIVEAGFAKRVMFGSDQMNWPEAIEAAIEAIESAAFLSAEEKRDILYNNAARFLRLSGEEIAAHHR